MEGQVKGPCGRTSRTPAEPPHLTETHSFNTFTSQLSKTLLGWLDTCGVATARTDLKHNTAATRAGLEITRTETAD